MSKKLLSSLAQSVFILTFSFAAIYTSPISAKSSAQYERYYEKALKFHKQKDYLRAIEWYEISLEANRENPDTLRGLGLAYLEYAKDLLKKASMSYEEALVLDPNHEQALEEMGSVLITSGQLVEVKDLLTKLERLRSLNAITLREKLDAVTQSAVLVTQIN
ncbi:hypothetical protein AB751O23_BH_00080 [Chlamydiales bacterium SCGC AB-751-O23]|jgi:tetratricopeptide (TPR) repeat protein|nr:hypothetical protein AB751O23_BH_00080 [Chlamydiales bacterium SCGC AB-751-O23]